MNNSATNEYAMGGRPLNATAASLHAGAQTGWDLVATAAREIGPFWSITRSQVYRELTAMAQDGLVEAGAKGSRDRRPSSMPLPPGRVRTSSRWPRSTSG